MNEGSGARLELCNFLSVTWKWLSAKGHSGGGHILSLPPHCCSRARVYQD